MRFSTIISALAVATSVTAAPSTSNLQATSHSLSPRTIELNDLAALVSATVINDLEQTIHAVLEQGRASLTQALQEFNAHIKEVTAKLSELLSQLADTINSGQPIMDGDNFELTCRSLKKTIAAITLRINDMLDQVPENQITGDLRSAVSSLEEDLDKLVSLLSPILPASSCQTSSDMQRLRDTLQRAKNMAQ